MKYTPVKIIFIGFLLIFLDFNINNLDILNDAFGFVFIAYGLYLLRNEHPYFTKAFYISLISLTLEILNTLTNNSASIVPPVFNTYLIGTVMTVQLFLTYFLFFGLAFLAQKQGNQLSEYKLKMGFIVYLSMTINTALAFMLKQFSIIFIVIGLILYVYILFLLIYAYNNLEKSEEILTDDKPKNRLIMQTLFLISLILPFFLNQLILSSDLMSLKINLSFNNVTDFNANEMYQKIVTSTEANDKNIYYSESSIFSIDFNKDGEIRNYISNFLINNQDKYDSYFTQVFDNGTLKYNKAETKFYNGNLKYYKHILAALECIPFSEIIKRYKSEKTEFYSCDIMPATIDGLKNMPDYDIFYIKNKNDITEIKRDNISIIDNLKANNHDYNKYIAFGITPIINQGDHLSGRPKAFFLIDMTNIYLT